MQCGELKDDLIEHHNGITNQELLDVCAVLNGIAEHGEGTPEVVGCPVSHQDAQLLKLVYQMAEAAGALAV